MRVKVVKAFGTHKEGDELTNMHPSTVKALGKRVEVITKETKNGGGPDDFFQAKTQKK
jgi:hypothetical protein